MTQLGVLFKRKRLTAGLKVSDLARLCGYTNLSHGSQRIHDLEKHGIVHPDLLQKVATILGISEAEYLPLLRADERERLKEWAEWLNAAIKPYLVLRLLTAMYHRMDLPEWIVTQQQAEQFVSEKAKELGLRCCLVWSRRLAIFFAADGTLEGVTEASPGDDVEPRQFIP